MTSGDVTATSFADPTGLGGHRRVTRRIIALTESPSDGVYSVDTCLSAKPIAVSLTNDDRCASAATSSDGMRVPRTHKSSSGITGPLHEAVTSNKSAAEHAADCSATCRGQVTGVSASSRLSVACATARTVRVPTRLLASVGPSDLQFKVGIPCEKVSSQKPYNEVRNPQHSLLTFACAEVCVPYHRALRRPFEFGTLGMQMNRVSCLPSREGESETGQWASGPARVAA